MKILQSRTIPGITYRGTCATRKYVYKNASHLFYAVPIFSLRVITHYTFW